MATSRSKTPEQALKARIGRNLRRARDEQGLTQAELARAAEVDDSQQISKWERGFYRPSDATLIILASVLERDLAWFYTEHPEQKAAA